MKRWLWFAAALALILAISAESYAGKDVGELQPVQTVRVSGQMGEFLVETDTGERGVGATLEEAFEDVEKTASSHLLFDTAEYLLLSSENEELIGELVACLRPSCCVCLTEGEVDLVKVGQFLQTHVPELTLMEYRAGMRDVPMLRTTDGRYELIG